MLSSLGAATTGSERALKTKKKPASTDVTVLPARKPHPSQSGGRYLHVSLLLLRPGPTETYAQGQTAFSPQSTARDRSHKTTKIFLLFGIVHAFISHNTNRDDKTRIPGSLWSASIFSFLALFCFQPCRFPLYSILPCFDWKKAYRGPRLSVHTMPQLCPPESALTLGLYVLFLFGRWPFHPLAWFGERY